MRYFFTPQWPVGYESSKLYETRWKTGFWQTFITGSNVLDIGYRGGTPAAKPICEDAIGIERDYPGYDGFHLPFSDHWADAIHASHILEHVEPAESYLREWFRVLRIGGHLILFVPSAYLYERRLTVPPSRWSPEHLRSYTPASLLTTIERALKPNSYRVRHIADADAGYDYALPLDVHPVGALEIECVIQSIQSPQWEVEP